MNAAVAEFNTLAQFVGDTIDPALARLDTALTDAARGIVIGDSPADDLGDSATSPPVSPFAQLDQALSDIGLAVAFECLRGIEVATLRLGERIEGLAGFLPIQYRPQNWTEDVWKGLPSGRIPDLNAAVTVFWQSSADDQCDLDSALESVTTVAAAVVEYAVVRPLMLWSQMLHECVAAAGKEFQTRGVSSARDQMTMIYLSSLDLNRHLHNLFTHLGAVARGALSGSVGNSIPQVPEAIFHEISRALEEGQKVIDLQKSPPSIGIASYL